MDLRLIETLQKIFEEDLFPNATPDEAAERQLEAEARRERIYNSFQIGDKVDIGIPQESFIESVRPVEARVENKYRKSDGTRLSYLIRVVIRSLKTGEVLHRVSYRPEDLEKVDESKINEEDLFPQASAEEVKRREVEQDVREEAFYNTFNIGDKVKIAWLENTFGSEVGTVVGKGDGYVSGYKYAIYVKFNTPSLRLHLNHKESVFSPEELIKVNESELTKGKSS